MHVANGALCIQRNVDVRKPVFCDNALGEFSAPNRLDFEGCEGNQQLRVALTDATAPANATPPKHVLATIFKTGPGDPRMLAPRTISFNLSGWVGKGVRIRVAQIDNRGPLRAGIDDIRLEPIG